MTTPSTGPVRLSAAGLAATLLLSSCARENAEVTSPSTRALALGEATLDQPVDNADVKQCARLSGRANLPAEQTLIIGVRNIDNGSPERYFGTVDNWEYPEDLKTWAGFQWFGSNDSSVGQKYRVELLTMSVDEAKKANRLSKTKGWHSPDNPPGTKVQAHITLKRVAGPGPAECS
jgi:hypothetical protein